MLLYFTGHGITGSKDLWLQTYGQEEVAEGQGISLADLVIRTRNKKGKAGFSGELTIILDTCFSGESMLSQALNLRDLGKRLTLFASSSENQESFPLKDPALPEISAFTASLLQALGPNWAKADTDGDGMLRYAELHIYAKNQLKAWAQEDKVAQLMEPTLLTNITEGFLAYRRDQIRVWNTSYRTALQTQEMNRVLAEHLQQIGANPQEKPTLPPEAQALAQGLIPEPEDYYAQALKLMGEGDLKKARILFAKATEQSQARETEEETKRQEALKQQQEAEVAQQVEQTKRYDLYLARARMETYDGKFTAAFTYYQQAAKVNAPTSLDLINEIGIAGLRAGKYPDAEPYLQQALEQREKELDPNHPDIGTSLNNLAELYRTQGKYAEAEPLYLRALRINEQALGAEHPQVALNLNNLAVLYKTQGKYAEAEPLYLRVITIFETALGIEHPNVGTALNNLALLFNTQGKYAEAEPLYRRSFWIFYDRLGAEHPYVQGSFGNYQKFLKTSGQPFDEDTVVRKLQQARTSISTQSSTTTTPASGDEEAKK